VLARADCIAVDSGHITVTHMPDIRKFSQALTLAAAGQRSMVALGAHGHMTVAVIPLQPAGPQGKAIEHFALLFSRASMCEALMLGAFARAHQLTPTEERVLGLISTGLTVPEMAKRLTLGPATIRTHVRNICAKTCCHGLREIVTRLAVMPALKVNIA
jgi:DNA-binding CsgD family transcriptional regulator